MTGHGPGTTLLATLTGRDAEDVATKPAEALRAIADLAKDMARLAADRSSDDPVVRAAAERRAAEIKALVDATPRADTGPAKERFQAKLEETLTRLVTELGEVSEEADRARTNA